MGKQLYGGRGRNKEERAKPHPPTHIQRLPGLQKLLAFASCGPEGKEGGYSYGAAERSGLAAWK